MTTEGRGMRWWRRADRPRPVVAPLVLQVPRLDGSGWPDPETAGWSSFDASTFYEMGTRRAYDLEAHTVADRLVEAALPRLDTGVSEQDAPYLHKTFLVAARIGAGIGAVERGLTSAAPGTLDRRIAGALWRARRGLPAMSEEWSRTGAWFLLAGHHLARTSPAADPQDVEALLEAAGLPDRGGAAPGAGPR
jgi:hypothetical protein